MIHGSFGNELLTERDFVFTCFGRYKVVDQGQVEITDLELYDAGARADVGRPLQNLVDILSEDILFEIHMDLENRILSLPQKDAV